MELGAIVIQPTTIYEDIYKSFLKERIIYYNDDIDDSAVDMIAVPIIKMNLEEADIPPDQLKPIKLYLNTDGGDAFVGMYLTEVIKKSRIPIHIYGLSRVCSAGLLIFLAGHKRFASSNTVFLLHDGEYIVANSSGKAKDTMKFLEQLEGKIDNFIKENTKITEEQYAEIKRKEFYCFGDIAKELGFVDEII